MPGFGAGQPPLGLNLYYLVSAHGHNEDDPDPISHRLLGKAMAILHENPMLEPAEIRDALAVDVDAGTASPASLTASGSHRSHSSPTS